MNSIRLAAGLIASLLAVAVLVASPLSAAEFDVTEFGATADDQTDDTDALERAFAACGEAGGGQIVIPAGTFIISRRNNESPILEVPPNTTVRGEGPASILTFDPRVNQSNFWRMIRAPVATGTKNVVIRDLRLDGSNTHPKYVWGNSRYNDQPGENITVADNQITVSETAISLNDTKHVRIHGNALTAPRLLLEKRTEDLTTDIQD